MAALIAIALAVQSVLAQDLDDDSALSPSTIPLEEVTFSKKMTVTLTPFSGCEDTGAVCFSFSGTSGVKKATVAFSGFIQLSECGPYGLKNCCQTFGYDDIETNSILHDFDMSYRGLTCSESDSDSEQIFQGHTKAFINHGWGKGTRRLTYDPQTGTGTLSMLAYLHVPVPPQSHRCGTQKCYTKGCCVGGCCIITCLPGQRCP